MKYVDERLRSEATEALHKEKRAVDEYRDAARTIRNSICLEISRHQTAGLAAHQATGGVTVVSLVGRDYLMTFHLNMPGKEPSSAKGAVLCVSSSDQSSDGSASDPILSKEFDGNGKIEGCSPEEYAPIFIKEFLIAATGHRRIYVL